MLNKKDSKYNNYSKNNLCLGCGKAVSNHASRCYACFGKTQIGSSKNIGRIVSKEQRFKIANSERLAKSGLFQSPSFICRVCKTKKNCKPYEVHIKKYCSKRCMYIGISKPQKHRRHFTTNIWYEIRATILKRDNYTCQECGATNIKLAIHHIIPHGKGGSDTLDNLISVCLSCHRQIDYALQQTKVYGVINGNLSKVW